MSTEKEQGYILLYDKATTPRNMTIQDVLKEVKENKVCYYDSSLGQDVPRVVHLGGYSGKELLDLRMVDVFKEINEHP